MTTLRLAEMILDVIQRLNGAVGKLYGAVSITAVWPMIWGIWESLIITVFRCGVGTGAALTGTP
ncbi:hypothetical protein D3C75_1198740 [compost metagenome]